MSHPNPSTAMASVLVDELGRLGVTMAIISPGSRSAALAIAAAEHPTIETRVVIDERSAGYHALGVAKASGAPVVVMSTSGTAVANFFPAVVEADLSCVPLIILSADRPAELVGVGVNQTIDQIELFGGKVRAFGHLDAPDSADRNVSWRTLVRDLVSAATGPRPGPVHLNAAFREPTVPVTFDGRTRGHVYPHETPGLDTPLLHGPAPRDPPPPIGSSRPLVVAGDGEYDRERLLDHAQGLGWPVLATALSGLRGREVVSAYHHILANGVPDELMPSTVVAVGSVGPSSRLESLIAGADQQIRIDRWGRHIDPSLNAHHVLAGDVNDLLAGVDRAVEPDWRRGWMSRDREVRLRLTDRLARLDGMTGAVTVHALNGIDWGAMVVASSLPIREVDAHLMRAGPVYANRGASGIDGFVSTALGVASSQPRSVALTGDLSLLHDGNAFLGEAGYDLCIVAMDNGGGGLFDQLPQATHAPQYERLFVTPPGVDLADLAVLHGLDFAEAPDVTALATEVSAALDRGGVTIVRVKVDRRYDLETRTGLEV